MGQSHSSSQGKSLHPQQKNNTLRALQSNQSDRFSQRRRSSVSTPQSDTPTSPLSILPGATRPNPTSNVPPLAQTIPSRQLALLQESPFVGSPLIGSEHFSQVNPPGLSRSMAKRMRSSSRLSEVSESLRNSGIDLQADDERAMERGADTELSLEGLDLQLGEGDFGAGAGGAKGKGKDTLDDVPFAPSNARIIPSRRPLAYEQLHTYVQPANERSYRNSAKIVHGFGPGGIAPLAQLGSRAGKASIFVPRLFWKLTLWSLQRIRRGKSFQLWSTGLKAAELFISLEPSTIGSKRSGFLRGDYACCSTCRSTCSQLN